MPSQKPDVAVHAKQLEILEASDKDQWDEINGIKKALSKLVPVWTTVVLMTMSCLTGSALTFAGMIMKFSGK